MSKNIYLGLM